MEILRLKAALALGAMLVAGCSPTLNWREVRPEGGGVAALMPCKPSVYERSVQLAGQTVKLALQACTAADLTWALAWADMGDAARVPAAVAELQASAAANLGSGPPSVKLPLAVQGAAASGDQGRFEISGRLPDGTAVREQVAVFSHGTRVIQVTVLGPSLPPEAMETFFSGLRLLP